MAPPPGGHRLSGFNGKTYPNLIGLFGELGVESYETEMTFGVSDRGRLEWAGTNLGTVFAQPGNLFSPRFIGMIRDLLRFNRNADAHLAECAQTPERTLGQLLDAHGYGQPLRTCIWCRWRRRSGRRGQMKSSIIRRPPFALLPEPLPAAGEQPAGVAVGAERFAQLRAAHLAACRIVGTALRWRR